MPRYLVVANQTLGGDHLLELLRERASQGDASIHVLVPATVDQTHLTSDEETDYLLARRRLDVALKRFSDLGVEVTGEVGEHLVVDTILDVLRRESFDEVIVSTLPAGVSRWLGLDLPRHVERRWRVPVSTVVVSQPQLGTAPAP
jgi:hypothetical protein